jgi:hypothetical protein
MTTKLSDEQRMVLQAEAGEPVAVIDEQSNRVYYLVDAESFAHLQGLQSEHEEKSVTRLRQQIAAGMEGPDIPADEVFSSLREAARELARTDQ